MGERPPTRLSSLPSQADMKSMSETHKEKRKPLSRGSHFLCSMPVIYVSV